jgi:hypothetical protein
MNYSSNGEMIMEYKTFDFPTTADGIHTVELKFCELMNKYRSNPNTLDPAELDFMDWANNVISAQ